MVVHTMNSFLSRLDYMVNAPKSLILASTFQENYIFFSRWVSSHSSMPHWPGLCVHECKNTTHRDYPTERVRSFYGAMRKYMKDELYQKPSYRHSAFRISLQAKYTSQDPSRYVVLFFSLGFHIEAVLTTGEGVWCSTLPLSPAATYWILCYYYSVACLLSALRVPQLM